MLDYANDGKCHNVELGTYGHECGKPATWLGTKHSTFKKNTTFTSGFCDKCKESGHEAIGVFHWVKIK